jgi:hypothetical protein
LSAFFASGLATDLVIAVLVVEVVVIALWRRRHGQSARLANLIAAALPGLCLVMALRAALIGGDWTVVALWLAASFPAHLVDLWRRPP